MAFFYSQAASSLTVWAQSPFIKIKDKRALLTTTWKGRRQVVQADILGHFLHGHPHREVESLPSLTRFNVFRQLLIIAFEEKVSGRSSEQRVPSSEQKEGAGKCWNKMLRAWDMILVYSPNGWIYSRSKRALRKSRSTGWNPLPLSLPISPLARW